MYQHVLQNQHSLLLVHVHTLFVTNTRQPRETQGAAGSQQSHLPMLLMHPVTKQDWKHHVYPRTAFYKNVACPAQITLETWYEKANLSPWNTNLSQCIHATSDKVWKVWKCKTLNKLFISFPQKLSCSTVNLAFQFSLLSLRTDFFQLSTDPTSLTIKIRHSILTKCHCQIAFGSCGGGKWIYQSWWRT